MKILSAIKKFSVFAVALLMMWGVVFSYNRVTDGFSIREMTSSLPHDPDAAAPPLPESQKNELGQILDQTYRYIGKGCQFYAFESADEKYVLKFFKHKHLRPLSWLKKIPMTTKWRQTCDEKIARRENRVRNLFASCQLAYEELPEETGILYLHLNRLPAVERAITLIDKLGIKHQIQLDDFEFVLQKKATQLNTAFSEIQDEDEMRVRVQQLVDLVILRCEKGIRDRDRSFAQNVAFCVGEPRAIFIDIGQFYKDSTIRQPEEQAQDLKKRLGNLRFWTERHYPALLPIVDQEIFKLD